MKRYLNQFGSAGGKWTATALLVLSGVAVGGQTLPNISGEIRPPRTEKFVGTPGLMIPWTVLSQTCDASTPNPTPRCRTLGPLESAQSHLLTLYDHDGDAWYRFSVWVRDPAYYVNSPRSDFEPLGPKRIDYGSGQLSHPDFVILRIVGESPNWYEVEINESTRATRFTLKADPLWSRVDWSNMSFNVVIDRNKVNVLDAPDGEPLLACSKLEQVSFVYSRLEGDWMLVNTYRGSASACKGWIRWRNGRDILVGSIINGMRVPEAPPAPSVRGAN